MSATPYESVLLCFYSVHGTTPVQLTASLGVLLALCGSFEQDGSTVCADHRHSSVSMLVNESCDAMRGALASQTSQWHDMRTSRDAAEHMLKTNSKKKALTLITITNYITHWLDRVGIYVMHTCLPVLHLLCRQ